MFAFHAGLLPRHSTTLAVTSINPTTLPIWSVDANTQHATKLAPADAAFDAYSLASIAEIASLLTQLHRCRLPITLVSAILSMAGLYSEDDAIDTRKTVSGCAPMDLAYLRYDIPPPPRHPLLQVDTTTLVLECVSHDQGWCAFAHELNLTYASSSSWVEFEVLAADGRVLVARRPVCVNLRASSTYRRHRLDVADELVPGSQVVMHLRADDPEWANHACYARIALRRSWRLHS
ncbi:Aste57867_9347 [Aphanomyces stellatus]|uniref:Aste57867_9347 protein n=1 Tax=Aphanomyces stellatus TaxID=120398 RepID=A0A485KMT0_9STRA|nr:hypothetical protein As57867_009311 [Aphanomyces stellatus]VFT86228.1 Aste57867_9347 [Aphanomyces stellatus]